VKLINIKPRRPEVQISPLIDVIFLLLIFYAVTTQFVTDERLKLDLPEAKTAEEVGRTREERPPMVKVAKDGSVWIDDQEVPEDELEARIEDLISSRPEQTLILQGDEGRRLRCGGQDPGHRPLRRRQEHPDVHRAATGVVRPVESGPALSPDRHRSCGWSVSPLF
jgi:biopolymer transport protein ExbD